MPWPAPKSLKTDEVYAVTAYLLNMGGVVPDNYVMSDRNIAEVQARLPNRNGMTLDHGMWPGKAMKTAGKPDVQATACMANCVPEPKVASFLPDFARNAHGNLADQNRLVGPQRGADTAPPASAGVAPAALLSKYSCTACHAVASKLVGPAFREIAGKYSGRADGVAYLAGKIQSGGSGVWGQIPMPSQTLSDTEARMISQWLVEGAKP
jgi:S-disulfanyl-L-cysteine oxidoreductase SoxD